MVGCWGWSEIHFWLILFIYDLVLFCYFVFNCVDAYRPSFESDSFIILLDSFIPYSIFSFIFFIYYIFCSKIGICQLRPFSLNIAQSNIRFGDKFCKYLVNNEISFKGLTISSRTISSPTKISLQNPFVNIITSVWVKFWRN